MVYKSKKNWKDYVEGSNHKGLTRRDFLARGMLTGAMSVGVSKLLMGDLVKTAMGAATTCPAPTFAPGAIAQFFSSGGPTMGARFISEAQAAIMNANMASNYGINGQATLLKLGPNMVIDTTSPFGFTLMQGPPGYPGGATAWQANVLSKISGGGHLGPFNADDGAGVNSGLVGGVSPFKASKMGKDLKVGASAALASWANGLPAASVAAKAAPAALASTFGIVPAATGLTNAGALTATSDAINGLTAALDPIFATTTRKGGQELMTSAGCGFYGNSALADPTYGTTLFNPANIPALTAKMTVASLTTEEQAQAAAFYQSAVGTAGGVMIQFNGRDYHGQNPATVIAPADIEEARAIVMFLAACDAAQTRGALIYLANGQAIAKGVQSVATTINGVAANVNAPVASGDAGGTYNAGLAIFYDPSGSLPASRFTGTVDTNGKATIDPNVASSKEAVAGLFLSALAFTNGGNVPAAALKAMQSAGVASRPNNIILI